MNKSDSLMRRKLIGGIAVNCLSPQVFSSVFNTNNRLEEKKPATTTPLASQTRLLCAQGSDDSGYSLSWFESSSISQVKSGFRGHGVSVHPCKKNTAVLFSRRPGTTGIEVDLASGSINKHFQCAKHFNLTGHGCFTHDGKYLITSENNHKTNQGHIVIRDSDHYDIQEIYPSYGIGPHEIKLLHNQNTLVIANGGILTHPKSGRKRLNLHTMRPNLTYFDLENGALIQTLEYREPKASIRHLDISQDNTVAIGLQMQRFKGYHSKTIALCATHKLGEDQIQPLNTNESIYQQLNDYVGSVCISPQHHIAGFTSPKGNLALFWNLSTKQLVNAFRFQDVCGIALSKDKAHFVLSNSHGDIRYIRTADIKENTALRHTFTGYQFDNHLVAL